jgi:hypothetical protein
MSHHATERNPFMLMINPEVVLAAVERSERLGQLNRHLCRPLDRPTPASQLPGAVLVDDDEGDADEPAERD